MSKLAIIKERSYLVPCDRWELVSYRNKDGYRYDVLAPSTRVIYDDSLEFVVLGEFIPYYDKKI